MNIGTMVKAGEDLEKLKKKRKSETSGEQLRRMCKDIADDITHVSGGKNVQLQTGWKIHMTSGIWWTGTSVTWARRLWSLEVVLPSGWTPGELR